MPPYSEKVYGDVSSVRGVEVAVCRCSFLGRVWGEFTAHREAERLVMRAKRLVERAERFMAERGDDRVGFDVWDMCLDALSTLRRALGRAESAGLSVEGLMGEVEAAEAFLRAGRGGRGHAYECLVRVKGVIGEAERRLSGG